MTSDRTEWLLNYPIVLPRDYDMDVIRHRVRTRGSALDGREGLGFKAYAIRVAGHGGSVVNEYSPFYAWTSASAAALFLAGGEGFQGIVADFGRPVVHTWLPLLTVSGALPGREVVAAQRWTHGLGADVDPAVAATAVIDGARALESIDGIHRAAVGIDPRSWEVVLYVTHDGSAPVPDAPGDLLEYQVLHVSEG